MSIEYAIDPAKGWDDQVGLRLGCSPAEAQAIHRALRALFRGRMSPLWPSHEQHYSHIIYVPVREDVLHQRWEDVLRLARLGGAVSPSEPETQPGAGTGQSRTPGQRPAASRSAATATMSYQAWEKQFREAVRLVYNSEDVTITQTVGFSSGLSSTELEDDEAVFDALPPPGRLRARIAHYARHEQFEKIVALCAERQQEVLALPASALLVSQLLDAHLMQAQETDNEALAATGRELARAFLPELERLRQADAIRVKLQSVKPVTPTDEQGSLTTLEEQLNNLVEVGPVERLPELEQLRGRYPKSTAIRVALADTVAALGDTDRALDLYRSDRAEVHVLDRVVELLLMAGRPREVLLELKDRSDLSPRLAGLRGAALVALGEMAQARPLLEHAWENRERSALIGLSLARALAHANDLERAAEPYQIAYEITPEALIAEDFRIMADIALGGGFGDLGNEEQAIYLDRYIGKAGRRLREDQRAASALKSRVDLRRAAEYPERFQESLADWLEYLAETANQAELADATNLLRDLRREGAITYQTQFELFEGIEHLASAVPGLGDLLALEYQSIAVEELTLSLRQSRPLPAYTADLRRALHFLSRNLADDLATAIEQERRAMLERSMAVPEEVTEEVAPLNLADISLTIVGGHTATRREVQRELHERYGLTDYQEIGPSSEEHIDSTRVRDVIANRDLVVVVAGYTGHDLTNHVRALQSKGELVGTVIWPRCRGKSGVVREILAACADMARLQ